MISNALNKEFYTEILKYNNRNWNFNNKNIDLEGTRTLNLRLRKPTPYPLGHQVFQIVSFFQACQHSAFFSCTL